MVLGDLLQAGVERVVDGGVTDLNGATKRAAVGVDVVDGDDGILGEDRPQVGLSALA